MAARSRAWARRQSCLLTVLAQHVDHHRGVPGILVLVVAGRNAEHAVAALRQGDGQGANHVAQAAGLAARGKRGPREA